jgi:hypothetical protein
MDSSNKRGRLPTRLAPVLAIVVLGAAVLALAAAAATTRAAVKPTNTSAPTISGTTTVGSTLTGSNGNWSGTAPINYTYQWARCDQNGGSCANISGATQQTYELKPVDGGNTLRFRVTATNSSGSGAQTTVPSAVVTTTPSAPATGCPAGAAGTTVAVGDIGSPARLQINTFQSTPSTIPGSFTSFTVNVRVSDTCGQYVSGAAVYGTAVPFNQVNVPSEQTTGSDGTATLTFNRLHGFPASKTQRLMVMFLRARKPGESPLAGITTSRLVSFKVNLHG